MRPEDALSKIRSSVHSPGPIRSAFEPEAQSVKLTCLILTSSYLIGCWDRSPTLMTFPTHITVVRDPE